jgi:hypothetical protein
MNSTNPLWGAPRIHGELLKLGIEVSQATVAKYMVRRVGTRGTQLLAFCCATAMPRTARSSASGSRRWESLRSSRHHAHRGRTLTSSA